MTLPTVSVIIPIYKVELYLQRCLDSVVNQSYTNLEIILIDDGSPDNCPEICDEYATKDKRIVVIHKENGGLSDARNAGTRLANGEYIYYLDADDEIPLNSISLLVEQVHLHPMVELVIGEMQSSPYTKSYDTIHFKNIDYINDNLWVRKHFYRIHDRLPVNACNKLIRREFITRNRLFFEKGLIHEDELWMFYAAQKASQIAFVHHTTYIRYINPGSITTATPPLKKIQAWDLILNSIFQSITEPCSNEQFFTYLTFWMDFYSVEKKDNLVKQQNWNSIIGFTRRKHFFLLEKLLRFYKFSFPFLKGHGIGLLIYLYSKKRATI